MSAKYYLASANILERQQNFISVTSIYYLLLAYIMIFLKHRKIPCFSVSKKLSTSAEIVSVCNNYFLSAIHNSLASALILSRRHNQFRASLNTNGYKFSSGRLAFFFCHDSGPNCTFKYDSTSTRVIMHIEHRAWWVPNSDR